MEEFQQQKFQQISQNTSKNYEKDKLDTVFQKNCNIQCNENYQQTTDVEKEKQLSNQSLNNSHISSASTNEDENGSQNHTQQQIEEKIKKQQETELNIQQLKQNSLGMIDDRYIIMKMISNNGIKSCLYKVYDIEDQQIYAIKSVSARMKGHCYDLEPEFNIQKEFDENNKNLLKLYRFVQMGKIKKQLQIIEESIMYIVFEYSENNDLLGFIQEYCQNDVRQTGLNCKLTRTIFKEIVTILEYIHKQEICHRDIKLDNILIGSDGILKLVDFGCSSKLQGSINKGYLDSIKGTEFFLPPEINRNIYEISKRAPYNGIKCDIFSLGVTLYCMLFNQQPFKKALPRDFNYRHIYDRNYIKFWEKIEKSKLEKLEKQEYEDITNLLQNMLEYDPDKRFSLEQIKESCFLKGETYTEEEFKKILLLQQ